MPFRNSRHNLILCRGVVRLMAPAAPERDERDERDERPRETATDQA